MSNITYLKDADFEEKVLSNKQEKPVLVDFWAEWCGPCRAITPLLEELADSHPQVSIAKINIDESPQQAANMGVMSIPTLILFNEGKEIERIIGADNARIRRIVEKYAE